MRGWWEPRTHILKNDTCLKVLTDKNLRCVWLLIRVLIMRAESRVGLRGEGQWPGLAFALRSLPHKLRGLRAESP